MPWSDCHSTSTHFSIACRILYNSGSYRTVDPFKLQLVPMIKISIKLILWMDDHILVSKLCLGSSSPDYKGTVFEIIEFSLFFLINYLIVRNGGLAFSIPVYATIAAINKTRIVHLLEGSEYGIISFLIQSIGVTRPIKTCSHLTNL